MSLNIISCGHTPSPPHRTPPTTPPFSNTLLTIKPSRKKRARVTTATKNSRIPFWAHPHKREKKWGYSSEKAFVSMDGEAINILLCRMPLIKLQRHFQLLPSMGGSCPLLFWPDSEGHSDPADGWWKTIWLRLLVVLFLYMETCPPGQNWD